MTDTRTADIMEQFIKEGKTIKLNIACGQQRQEGFIGIDKVKTEATDIVWDLEDFPWQPIPDNCIDEALISHYVEHTKDLIKFMDELYRIIKVGAKCTVIAPFYNSMRAWQDPTHLRAISEATFLYYNKVWREQNKLDHYPIKSDFDFQYGYLLTPDWASREESARNFAIRHYTNVVNDIQVTLVKK